MIIPGKPVNSLATEMSTKMRKIAILKSWEDLGMSDKWCAILEKYTQNSFERVSRVQGWLNER